MVCPALRHSGRDGLGTEDSQPAVISRFLGCPVTAVASASSDAPVREGEMRPGECPNGCRLR
ncbi:hypothetical protein AGR3A_Lc50014 [Agrobacterium tomkonis CFBP 6623]|uniref:Uncharacterized protein n=1 Tax=Agrobacterium tomkonis CFBP 6623 TaxID=1183432 RepID=A0A1S7S529_9HYPH|nr:hypothetical protein AGR3A_Lc50014 [Agrobacterium tomkonis CFBP 6623]